MDVLKDKSYKEYSHISRYNEIPYYYHVLDDKYIQGKANWLDDSTIYTEYTIQRLDTLDSLALDFYNNPTLYWIIASFNRIKDPFEPLKIGQKLKIPSLSNIRFDKWFMRIDNANFTYINTK